MFIKYKIKTKWKQKEQKINNKAYDGGWTHQKLHTYLHFHKIEYQSIEVCGTISAFFYYSLHCIFFVYFFITISDSPISSDTLSK